MFIPENDGAELRKWIIKKLEALEAVADADVLADFVIALLRTDTAEPQLRRDAYQELEDFLKEHTKQFVDDVFATAQTKSYLPGYKPPVASAPAPLAALPQPTRSSVPFDTGSFSQQRYQGSKKRSHNDMQGHEQGSDPGRGARQTKQMRRGSRGRGANSNGSDRGDNYMGSTAMDWSSLNPTFDPSISSNLLGHLPEDFASNPFAAMVAMQAMGFPKFPQPPQTGSVNTKRKRCRDYDTKGFCARGEACRYQHGADHMVVPGQDEYDPKNAMLNSTMMPPTNGHVKTNGAARGSTDKRGGRGRADFSQAGPNYDRSNTAIVVEQIPEEKFEEQSVRDFFSEFGSITEVTMQPYKRLAIVEYDDYISARNAYDSPKVIFDNRFVKVYWYKPNSLPTEPRSRQGSDPSPSATSPEEQPFDRGEFERRSSEAQKRLEEKLAQMKETAAQRETLERQKADLAQKQAEEKKRLLEKLKARESKTATDEGETHTTNGANGTTHHENDNASASTKALRAKLAELEAEAQSLGIDHQAPDTIFSPRGRGRGRGRGSYRGWEAFNPSYRGSPRGRGGWGGGGKYNLDLRTKKVCVSGVAWTGEQDEGLRQHLLGVGEFEAINSHPDLPDSMIVSFQDRPTAESFFYGSRDLAGVGKVEFSWYNAPSVATNGTTKGEGNGVGKQIAIGETDGDGDVGMHGADGVGDGDGERAEGGGGGEVDYDVAEEDHRWD
ncbi:uncharacterized protein KY384_007433 [Bacidia gigantensis]|uniref:uncharacterized protein n=1 Tax=Bacidia gigantensis TaxID=2732470 RepID=UPI001D05621C|nr:uncharacterized protein KY384_007433 [Bacidia gigantensis]KAG8528515.1 hypothetical protein KY384_007433 [Bacidia gigantensis]